MNKNIIIYVSNDEKVITNLRSMFEVKSSMLFVYSLSSSRVVTFMSFLDLGTRIKGTSSGCVSAVYFLNKCCFQTIYTLQLRVTKYSVDLCT